MTSNQPNINRLLDVEMNVTVRFGKTEMPLKDIVHFGVGSMLELNRTVDDPVELLVNNYPFARGEVVVVDGYYGVRVTEIGSAEERTQGLFPSIDGEERSSVADFGAALAAEDSAGPAAAPDELVADDANDADVEVADASEDAEPETEEEAPTEE